jgi:hypothetical protein
MTSNNAFFKKLSEHNQLCGLVESLDWLLSDSRFVESRWDKNRVTRFTKQAKRLPGAPSVWQIEASTRIAWSQKTSSTPLIQMINGDSEGKDLLRHIRNAIAHGNAAIRHRKGELLFEGRDFSNKAGKPQTAYLLFPLELISKWYELYKSIQSSKNGSSRKSRKERKGRGR